MGSNYGLDCHDHPNFHPGRDLTPAETLDMLSMATMTADTPQDRARVAGRWTRDSLTPWGITQKDLRAWVGMPSEGRLNERESADNGE